MKKAIGSAIENGLPNDFPADASETVSWFVHRFIYMGKKPERFVGNIDVIPLSIAEIVARTGEDTSLESMIGELEQMKFDRYFDR